MSVKLDAKEKDLVKKVLKEHIDELDYLILSYNENCDITDLASEQAACRKAIKLLD